MKSNSLINKTKPEIISILREFISSNPEARELKRALAIAMAIEEYPYADIINLLGVHKPFISYWKRRFLEQGLAGIKLGYQGAQSYLKDEERQSVIEWLRSKNHWDLEELVKYIEENYGVVYQSRQSYYDLFANAGISWKKSQKQKRKLKIHSKVTEAKTL
jgi:putative transposase